MLVLCNVYDLLVEFEDEKFLVEITRKIRAMAVLKELVCMFSLYVTVMVCITLIFQHSELFDPIRACKIVFP